MKYGFHMTINQLLKDPKSRQVFEHHVPKLLKHPMLGMVKNYKLEDVVQFSKTLGISDNKVQSIKNDLEQL